MNYKYDLIIGIVIFLLEIALPIPVIWVYDGGTLAWLAISAGTGLMLSCLTHIATMFLHQFTTGKDDDDDHDGKENE